MNLVQLYKYIEQIVTTIPIVHSYSNQTPYEYWNTSEVRYGSVVFAIKTVRTVDGVLHYDGLLYYGDRLNANNTNVSAVQSDAILTIQTIINAIKNSEEDIDCTYPIQCVLFEQKFADELAGAYANITITVQNFVECE